MRPLYILVGAVALGISLVGWVTLGKAGPESTLPPPPPTDPVPAGLPPTVNTPAIRPIPKPRPADDLFDIPSPTSAKPGRKEFHPPVRSTDPIELPEGPKRLPATPSRIRTDVKPTVFIPNSDSSAPSKVVPAVAAGALVRQEPAISLEWQGPPTLQINAPAEYTLVARIRRQFHCRR